MRQENQDINIYELDSSTPEEGVATTADNPIELENTKTSDLGDIDGQMGHVELDEDHSVEPAGTHSTEEQRRVGPALGLVAAVLGVSSVFTSFIYMVGIPLALLAVILGWVSISRRRGCDPGLVGVIAGGIGLVFAVLILVVSTS